METYYFDNVKAEKENAIARYRRFRSLAKLLQFVEVFVALTLLSWSWTRLPAAVRIAGEYVFELSVYILNPHVVFLIGNAIVIVLYVLSRHYDDGMDAVTADLYGDYVRDGESHQQIAAASDGESPTLPTPETKVETGDDEQIACSENAVSEMQCEAAATAIEEATRQIQRFQRTQSEKLKRQISVKSRRELRRSETEIRQIVVTSDYKRGTMTSLNTVESLSNEEFRLTIEAFIAKQQRFLWAQKMAEENQ